MKPNSCLRLVALLANIRYARGLIIRSASMAYRQLQDDERSAAGAGPDGGRLSIGNEDTDHIIGDLGQALLLFERQRERDHEPPACSSVSGR